MVAIEDAGWEIRDCLMWVYGSGFPKSLDVSKAIDKAAGAEREIIDVVKKKPSASSDCNEGWVRPWAEGKTTMDITAPATDAAKQWNGWGTALKPAYEIIVMCRKPLEGTVANNVQKWGVGGLNIDGCRVVKQDGDRTEYGVNGITRRTDNNVFGKQSGVIQFDGTAGRFPANLIHDGSEEVVDLLPNSKTTRIEKPSDCRIDGSTSFECMRGNRPARGYDGEGSAARFFYCAKASKSERNFGLPEGTTNTHPTVKPLSLLQYLCRLITPPGGLILDPFSGSGSTGIASDREGFNSILIEIDIDYAKIAEARTKSKH
jgi:site-specific DNA-methyltransferase (adenine-specific)